MLKKHHRFPPLNIGSGGSVFDIANDSQIPWIPSTEQISTNGFIQNVEKCKADVLLVAIKNKVRQDTQLNSALKNAILGILGI